MNYNFYNKVYAVCAENISRSINSCGGQSKTSPRGLYILL